MKKTIVVALLFVMVALISSTVLALTANELVDYIYEKGSKYGITKADTAKMTADVEKREEAGDPITDEQAANAKAKVDEIIALLESKGVESLADGKEKLTSSEINQIKALAVEAGNAVGVEVSVKIDPNKVTVSIYDPITKTTVLSVAINPETGERIKSPTGASVASAVVASFAVVAVAVVAAIKVKKEA